jgi:hypothetical protein
LRQAQLADQSLSRTISDTEWSKEGTKDRGILWDQLADQTILECDASLAHLDEEGFVYYLPAYLSFAVRNLSSRDSEHQKMIGFVISSLSNRSNYGLARYKRLSDRQIDLVIKFLRLVCGKQDHYGNLAGKALKRYWEKPDARRRTIIEAP